MDSEVLIHPDNIKQEPPVEFYCYLPDQTENSNEKDPPIKTEEIKSEEISVEASEEISKARKNISDEQKTLKHKKYECDNCSYKGLTKTRMFIHLRVHTRPFKCEVCQATFSSKLGLQRHSSNGHNQPKNFPCYCGRDFNTLRAMRIHRIKGHDEDKYKKKPFLCNFCPYAAKLKYLMIRHLKNNHMKSFECTYCGKKYSSEKRLINHLTGGNRTKCRKLLDFSCKFCSKQFKNYKSLQQHIKSHAGREECPICLQMLSASFIKQHIRMHEVRKAKPKHQCEACSKLFVTGYQLSLHKRRYKKLFECDFCGHRLASKTSLMEHTFIHVNPETFKCLRCPRIFHCSSNLTAHTKKEHLKLSTKKEKCTICQQMFPVNDIAEHIKMHEVRKTRPTFQCEVCSKQFFMLDLFKQHKIEHKKHIECDFCGQKFMSNKRYFIEHLLKHVNPHSFKCKTCQRLYATKYSLKCHKKLCR